MNAKATYSCRLLDSMIRRKLESVGAVFIQGPRAVGKTTTALHHAKSAVRLDESEQTLRMAQLDSKALFHGSVPRLIDEWQLAPNIWNTVRHEIDARGEPGQFILTGSAAPSEDKTRHTGAGRVARIALRTMSLAESSESIQTVPFQSLFDPNAEISGLGGPDVEDYAGFIVRGGWPALIKRPVPLSQEALIDYVDNLANVDMRTLESPPDPVRMMALFRALSRNIATEAAIDTLAREAEIFDAEVSGKSVRKYLDQLTRIFILEELPSWRPHIRSSIQARVKPKWHFSDPSIAAAALRLTTQGLLGDLAAMGLFFESLCVRDLRVYADLAGATVSHYRDSSGLEIDVVLERYDGKWAAVEVKLGGEDAIESAVANFAKLRTRLTSAKLANLGSMAVLTAGKHSYKRADGINVIALGHLAGT
jgi:predicted AAA+ superfamily ATPase